MAAHLPGRPRLPSIPSGGDIDLSWPSGSSSQDHYGAPAAAASGAPPSPLSPTSSDHSVSGGGRIRAGAFGRGSRSSAGSTSDGDRLYQGPSHFQSPPEPVPPLPQPTIRPPLTELPQPPSSPASTSEVFVLYPPSPLGTAGHSPNLLAPGIFLPSRTLPALPTDAPSALSTGDPRHSEASMSVYSGVTSYGAPGSSDGPRSMHSRPFSVDTRASGSNSGGGTELMMDILAGQAAVDVRALPFAVLGWDEVEDAKKELSLLENRLQSLVSRHQREQKILTAARTLAGLHVNHKRMSHQTMEELAIAEKRAASAEKDMWAVKSREASLRRRLTEHYASILTWETNRLQTALRSASSTPQPFPPFQSTLDRSDSVLSKGKSRETELDIEVKRLNSRVRELEELVGDAGECEAVVHTELKNVQRQFDGHRSKTEEYRASLEREIQALQGQLRDAEEKHAHYRTREEDSRVQGIEGLRSILAPLLDRTSIPEEETLEDLALVVQDAFKGLEAKLEALRGEIKESQDGVERERARLVKEAERSYQDSLTKERKWDEERGGYLRQVKELSTQHRRQRSTDASSTLELASINATLSHLWNMLPSASTPTSGSARTNASFASARAAGLPPAGDFDLAQFIASFSVANKTPYPGIEAFSSRLKGFIEDALTVVERTGKYARERDIHKSNSERAQSLVMESRGALETYQRQVRALEERLETEGGGGQGSDSLAHFNELERTIAELRDEKRRMEASLRSQMEACDSLSEANEALSQRAMSISEVATAEKRSLQEHLETSLGQMRQQLLRTQEELDEFRAKDMQGPGIAMLEEVNALQDEVQMLRSQLRSRGGGV